MPQIPRRAILILMLSASMPPACQSGPSPNGTPSDRPPPPPAAAVAGGTSHTPNDAPPPAIQAWMDRLTVPHFYDPATGFIVAREPVALPPLLAKAPPLDRAIAEAASQRLVVVFVTADRCAPCQQYKLDALNDPTVVARLSEPRFVATHLEVDREPELAVTHLGSRGIPMTYALRDGAVVATLRGQRSASELLAWLEGLPDPSASR